MKLEGINSIALVREAGVLVSDGSSAMDVLATESNHGHQVGFLSDEKATLEWLDRK